MTGLTAMGAEIYAAARKAGVTPIVPRYNVEQPDGYPAQVGIVTISDGDHIAIVQDRVDAVAARVGGETFAIDHDDYLTVHRL